MMMNSEDTLFVFVTDLKISDANLLMKSIDRSAEDTGDQTFGAVRLSPTGTEPRTHSGCCTAADIAYRTSLDATSHSPWMTIYRLSDGWTWETACTDMGLQTITTEV